MEPGHEKELQNFMETLQRPVVVTRSICLNSLSAPPPGWTSFPDIAYMSFPNKIEVQPLVDNPDQMALIMFTSRTSGTLKGVPRCRRAATCPCIGRFHSSSAGAHCALEGLSKHSDFTAEKVSCVRVAHITGSVVALEMLKRLEKLFPKARASGGYGMTEAFRMIGWPGGTRAPRLLRSQYTKVSWPLVSSFLAPRSESSTMMAMLWDETNRVCFT
ncbi:hypothetical protein GX50_02236 [[Emmonsia] crescens]|uniref:AMP-dependent synthetase/ligase domain-containing protein n=1 Tax=[Emmonsia] crescens TaxID=73230 RepID=A0A2B7ZMK6_9EURO|nr:hypothetical protein GX50_02236 [Emmonsia crescens]